MWLFDLEKKEGRVANYGKDNLQIAVVDGNTFALTNTNGGLSFLDRSFQEVYKEENCTIRIGEHSQF